MFELPAFTNLVNSATFTPDFASFKRCSYRGRPSAGKHRDLKITNRKSMNLQEKLKKANIYESQIRHFSCNSADCDEELIKLIKEALNFSIESLSKPHEGYKNSGIDLLWFEITNNSLCGAIGTLLEKEKQLRGSEKLINFFIELSLQKKWRTNVADFIFILLTLKSKDGVAKVANNKEIWINNGFIQFSLIESIFKLKIPGFSQEFIEMKKIAEQDGDKQMLRYINKYLERERIK